MKLLVLLIIKQVLSQNIQDRTLSISRDLYSGTSLQNENLIFFAGGENGLSITYDTVDIYNSNTNQWTTNKLSIPRYSLTATSLSNFGLAFFAGGQDINNNCFSNVDIYNSINNTWSVNYLSTNRYLLTSTNLENKGLVFFAGGFNSTFVFDTIDIYSAITNKWTTAKLSIARGSLVSSSLQYDNLAFFAGGRNNDKTFDTIDIYNANINKWSTSKLSIPRTLLTAASLSHHHLTFFMGGIFEEFVSNATNVIDLYNSSSNSWSIMFLPVALYDMSTIALESSGLIYVGGGFTVQNEIYQFSQEVYIYDVNLNNWTNTSFMHYMDFRKPAVASLEKNNLVFFSTLNAITNESPVNIFNNCPGGYTSSSLNKNRTCAACQSGTYANSGYIKCTICPAGSYCPPKSITPTPIIPGCWSNIQGSYISCDTICWFGNYCPAGSSSQTPCPQGTYCPTKGMSSPINCPKGTYNQNTGSTLISNCLICPAGYYCNKEFGATNYMACSIGYYCPIGSYIQTICQGGNYCPFGSQRQTKCPINTFSLPGSGMCTQCPKGQYTNNPGSESCEICPTSRWNLDGWHCMDNAEKWLFVASWVLTGFSAGLSIWKLREFVKERIKKMKSEGINFSIRNFIFINKIKKKYHGEKLLPLHKNEDDSKEFQKNISKEIVEIKAKLVYLDITINNYFKLLQIPNS